jgi:hypothetical protein
MFVLIICKGRVYIINPLRAENNPVICAKRAGRQAKVWACLALGGEGVDIRGDWSTGVGRSNTAHVL